MLRWAACLLLSLASTVSAQHRRPPNRHVLLIGLDGTRPDALMQAVSELNGTGQAPAFVRLFERGVFDLNTHSGGAENGATQQATASGPAWATVFTGVYSNRHGLTSTDDLKAPNARLNNTIPTLFNYIYHNVPHPYTAVLYDYKPLGNLLRNKVQGAGPEDVFEKETTDAASAMNFANQLSQLGAHVLNHRDPQLMFFYTVAIDAVGHDSGFGPSNPDYVEAIKKVAGYLELILAKIAEKREEGKEWLIIMLSDHGGKDNTHGSQAPENRRTFMVFENPADEKFSNPDGAEKLREVRTGRGLDAVTPTILAYLMGDAYDEPKFPLLSSPLDPTAPPKAVVTVAPEQYAAAGCRPGLTPLLLLPAFLLQRLFS